MSKDATNAERQRRFRQRRRERNATVTPGIAPAPAVTDTPQGIVYRNGHTYYTHPDGRVYAIVCCQVPGCPACDSSSAHIRPEKGGAP